MTPAELKALDAAATKGPWAPRGDTWIEAGERGFDEVLRPDNVECGTWCLGGSSRVEFSAADRSVAIAARNALPALIRLWEAAEDCDNAHRHVDVCEVMRATRGCSCGHERLEAALRELREMRL